MDITERIMEKKAYLVDIFPETVPQKADNRYFEVERYFQRNRSEFDRKLTAVILKLYCYFDYTVESEDRVIENPQTAELTVQLEKCFRGESGYINIVLTECEAMLTVNRDDLYMSVYNVSGRAKELLAELTASEGLFFYEAPTEG